MFLLLVSNTKYEIKYVLLKFQVLTDTNHEGTHWVRIEQPRESKIIFKWASNLNDSISLPSYRLNKPDYAVLIVICKTQYFHFRLNVELIACGE